MAENADIHARVRYGLLADLLQRQPLLAAINAAVGLLFVVGFAGAAPTTRLAGWLLYLLAAQIGRVALWRTRKRITDAAELRTVLPWLVMSSAAAGAAWGLIGPLFAGLGSPAQQMLVPFFLAGMGAGSIASLPSYRPAFYAFLLPALLPYAIVLAGSSDTTSRIMGAATLLYAIGLAVVGHQIHRSLRRMGRLHLENETLSERLEEARHDTLTGLPTRELFHTRLRHALALARRSSTPTGLLLIDLDGFKDVNDRMGHPAGDRLLVIIAERLGAALRAGDTLGRLGGDEFAVLQPSPSGPEACAALAHRLQEQLSAPLWLHQRQLQVTASIGIVLSVGGTESPEELMARADLALYRAKGEGRGQFCFFELEMERAVRRHRRTERELRRALAHGELELHVEPELDLHTNRIGAVEALACWNHHERGQVSAGEFMSIVSTSSVGLPFGTWLLDEACALAAHWQQAGTPLRVAVGLLPAQLRQPNLLEKIDDILAGANLDPARLELRIGAAELTAEDSSIARLIEDLAHRRIAVTIDVLGAGSTSLGLLSHMPVRGLRLAASLVGQIGVDLRDEAAIRGLVDLGHASARVVAAAGVQTAAQLAFLREAGCDAAQGPLIGKSVRPGQMPDRLGIGLVS